MRVLVLAIILLFAAGPAHGVQAFDSEIAMARAANAAMGGCTRPPGSPPPGPPQAYRVDGGVLVELPCAMLAYNYTHRYFIVRPGEPAEALSFVDYEDGRWFALDQAFNAEFDPLAGALTTFSKAAGHGGCGSQARFLWRNQRFELVEMKAQSCPGNTRGRPFPTIWRARN